MITSVKRLTARIPTAKVGAALLIFLFGAYAAVIYLEVSLDSPVRQIGQLRSFLDTTLLYMVASAIVLQWRRDKPGAIDISPARSGVRVVVATGLAAAVALGWGSDRPADLVVPGLVVALTLGIAWIVARYASRHGDQIGEARFGVRDRVPAG